MSHHAEQNERQSRTHALVLAISLHLALAAVFYLYTSDEPAPQLKQPVPVNKEQNDTAPKAKTVKLP